MTKQEFVISIDFLYDFKNKRYNVNSMYKIQSEPKHFGSFICDIMNKLNIKRTFLNTGISDNKQIASVI